MGPTPVAIPPKRQGVDVCNGTGHRMPGSFLIDPNKGDFRWNIVAMAG